MCGDFILIAIRSKGGETNTLQLLGFLDILVSATFWKKDFKIFAYSEKVCNFALAVSL
jgi:hypothetical protein